MPDMLVMGKGLGGGVFPMAALIAREDLDVAADRALGHYTHEKSSVGCAAALATLDVIRDEELLERSRVLGAHGLERLRRIQAAHPAIRAVRGLGVSFGVEMADAAFAETRDVSLSGEWPEFQGGRRQRNYIVPAADDHANRSGRSL